MNLGIREIKTAFFDAAKVLKSLDAAQRRALSKAGAFVRRRAKSSIRYGKKPSAPGQPPTAHRSSGYTRKKRDAKTGRVSSQASSPLRELLFFAYDETKEAAVVGPVKFGSRGGIAPALLEFGGTESRTPPDGGAAQTLHYAPRPYMRPAHDAERPRFADLFKGSM